MRLGSNLFSSFILMLITPLVGLIMSVRRHESNSLKKWALTFFSGLYASTLPIEGIGDGTIHWKNVFVHYKDLTFSQFWSEFYDIVTFTTNYEVNEDLYIHILSYFIGGVLATPHLFFVIVGLVYGYFFSSSILKLFSYLPRLKANGDVLLLALYFICMLNIQSMVTVRTWTGFWVMFYGTLQYLSSKRLKYLVMILCAPFFHVGYFIMSVPVCAGIFLQWNKRLVVLIFVASFFVEVIPTTKFLNSLQQVDVGKEKVEAYHVDNTKDYSEYQRNWYWKYRKSKIVPYAIVIICLLYVANGDYFRRMNSMESTLFTAGLLTKAFSNSSWFLFAVSNRSNTIAEHLLLAGILIYRGRLSKNSQNFHVKSWLRLPQMLSLVAVCPVFFYYFAEAMQYTSVYMVSSPLIVWLVPDSHQSIRDFLLSIYG